MRLPTTVLFVLFYFFSSSQSPYENPTIGAYNDSVLIYNIYKAQANLLKTLKETDRKKWNDLSFTADTLTACAKNRLRLHNHKSYVPVGKEENRILGESTFIFPEPSEPLGKNLEQAATPEGKKGMYSITDTQIHFFKNSITQKTDSSFIGRYYFHKGLLLKDRTEKLNPITKAVIKNR